MNWEVFAYVSLAYAVMVALGMWMIKWGSRGTMAVSKYVELAGWGHVVIFAISYGGILSRIIWLYIDGR